VKYLSCGLKSDRTSTQIILSILSPVSHRSASGLIRDVLGFLRYLLKELTKNR